MPAVALLAVTLCAVTVTALAVCLVWVLTHLDDIDLDA